MCVYKVLLAVPPGPAAVLFVYNVHNLLGVRKSATGYSFLKITNSLQQKIKYILFKFLYVVLLSVCKCFNYFNSNTKEIYVYRVRHSWGAPYLKVEIPKRYNDRFRNAILYTFRAFIWNPYIKYSRRPNTFVSALSMYAYNDSEKMNTISNKIGETVELWMLLTFKHR